METPKEQLIAKIESYNQQLPALTAQLYAGIGTLRTGDDIAKVIKETPDLWREMRKSISALMTVLNLQAKYVEGALNVYETYDFLPKINIDNDTVRLLYTLEFFNFTVSMGKPVNDWVSAGEGLFFATYFSAEIASRPWSDDVRQQLHTFIGAFQKRRSDRYTSWTRKYPKKRQDSDAHCASFLADVALVAQKNEEYKTVASPAWEALAKVIKSKCPGVSDVDWVAFADVAAAIRPDGLPYLFVLTDFFGRWFIAAEKSLALFLDLIEDKRLPTILRVALAWQFGSTPPFPMTECAEWMLLVLYNNENVTDKLLEMRKFVMDARTPLVVAR